MKQTLWISVLLGAACTSLPAQHMGGPRHFPARQQGFHPGYLGSGHGAYGRGRNVPALYPFPLLDPLYSDYLPAEPAQPGSVLMPSPAPSRTAEAPARQPSQPLLIELRGNDYVQLSGDADSKLRTITPQTTDKLQKPQPSVTQKPALLIFRDGHQEEVADYTISNGVLYATADYYSSGSWNHAIQISSLNVPQTIASNESRGVPFHLPTSPNEVVVGP